MSLDDAQRRRVAQWIAQGLKLSEIQKQIASELGVSLTYMETRLLADDLKLVPKDPEPPVLLGNMQGASGVASAAPGRLATDAPPAQPKHNGVSVSVHQVALPGTVVSGDVTFSDGNSATWVIDQYGTPGLTPKQPGYRPSQGDIQAFQKTLQAELARMGFY